MSGEPSSSAGEASSSAAPAPMRSDRRGSAGAGGAQAASAAPAKIGGYKYTFKDKQMVDYIRTATRSNVWYYRDRLNTPRGPCTLPVLKEAWTHGIIDENTLVWGQGLMDWLPAKNVRTLVPQIRTVEVQVATWIKKTFALKPALESVRKQRAAQRGNARSSQVDNMY